MKTIDVVFRNGHFYDKLTDSLVTLYNEREAVLVVSHADDLILETAEKEVLIPLASKEKLQVVKGKCDVYRKIFSQGESLFVDVRNGNKKVQVEVELCEDLYLYKQRKWKVADEVLFECICKVKLVDGRPLKKIILGASLNDLYKQMYVHFNLNDGNPASNAITAYYINRADKRKNIDSIRVKKEVQVISI